MDVDHLPIPLNKVQADVARKCPLFMAAAISRGNYATSLRDHSDYCVCLRNNCEWWVEDDTHKMCLLWTIAGWRKG